MNKTIKALALSAVAVILTAFIGTGAAAAENISDDPADSYQKLIAPAEDETLSLWFEPSFKKVYTSDITSSGKDTYSVYMAKNEVENAQFVLYSDTDKAGLTAEVSDFINDSGATIPAELFYEMYVTVDDLNTTNVYGATKKTTFIREGEAPDPVAPMKNIGKFKLNGGKSQAFFIKLRSAEDTPSGWYSATLDIKNSDGDIIKTATVFAYVWDFTLSEKTALQTAFYTANDLTYSGSYKAFFDYLLDNRICSMDLPGTLNSSNPYLTMDRVNAVRVSAGGCGSAINPYYMDNKHQYSAYAAIYDELHSSDIWEDVKDKFYFYTADEPYPAELRDISSNSGKVTIDDVNELAAIVRKYWEDPQLIVPIYDNHPYPYYHYTSDISNYPSWDKKDAIQEMVDSDSMTVWCPMMYAFTPNDMITKADPSVRRYLRNLDYSNSGNYTAGGKYTRSYYDWCSVFGEMSDRMKSRVALDENGTHKLWAYTCFGSHSYSYCNILIENTGLQSKMMFWQMYQEDVTGFLYYATNGWSVSDSVNGYFYDTTPTGDKTVTRWKTNKSFCNNASIYGDGVLFYGASQGRVRGVNLVGSLRVEIMRDGIEEYQMFKMLEELRGNDAAKAIVAKVSNNVADYLTMPLYTAENKPDAMDDYDYMEAVRRELGNAVEAAAAETKCSHNWDDGVVTVEATCLKVGETHFTCTKCGAEKTEIIPAIHTVGNSFTAVSGKAATCTADGNQIMRCGICGYEKKVVTTAFHDDASHYVYKQLNNSNHQIYCDVCGELVERSAHKMETKYTNTCTESGEKQSVCRHCGYTEILNEYVAPKGHKLETQRVEPTCTEDGYESTVCRRCDYSDTNALPATGHSFEDGVCVWCGEIEGLQFTPGDINNDGRINAKDSNLMKRIVLGSADLDEISLKAADINGDGKINTKDIYLLKKLIIG